MNDSTDFGLFGSIAEQRPAFEALIELASMFGALPPAYVTVQPTAYCTLRLQCDTAVEFEAWRTALQIPEDEVTLHASSTEGWLAVETVFRGQQIRLTGFGVQVTREQVKAPTAVTA